MKNGYVYFFMQNFHFFMQLFTVPYVNVAAQREVWIQLDYKEQSVRDFRPSGANFSSGKVSL